MKLVRYCKRGEPNTFVRLGVVLEGDLVGDLRAGYANYLLRQQYDTQSREVAALRFPSNIADFLRIGPAAQNALRAAADWLDGCAVDDSSNVGMDGERLLVALDQCHLYPPVIPKKIIAVGRNYREHLAAVGVDLPMLIPSAWIKATSAIVGPFDDIVKPSATKELDYETELTIVIGKQCKNVPEGDAYDVIAGYTILNDISARDVVRRERAEGNQLLGKMFDGFAPTGPWMVTKDEISDPMNLTLLTRVNGEIRQNSNTSQMVWSIPQLIAFLSQMTLEPGDMITTGTPGGVAFGRKPDEMSWYLNEGDIVESELESIGAMRNKIVNESSKEGGWKW